MSYMKMVKTKRERGLTMKETKRKTIFAEGLCWRKVFIFFLLGCIFGTVFEEVLWFLQNQEWTRRQGVIYGPFSPLYGIGFSIYVIFLGKKYKERNIWKTFFYCCIIGGVTEYIASWFIEKFFHIKYWDYANIILNIHGRTAVPIMIVWGILGTVLIKWIYPRVSNWIEKIPYKIGETIYVLFLIFIAVDMILSFSAFGRMFARKQGKEPQTFIGKFYDEVYNDEFMYKTFPILKGKI